MSNNYNGFTNGLTIKDRGAIHPGVYLCGGTDPKGNVTCGKANHPDKQFTYTPTTLPLAYNCYDVKVGGNTYKKCDSIGSDVYGQIGRAYAKTHQNEICHVDPPSK